MSQDRAEPPELHALEGGLKDYIGCAAVINKNSFYQVVGHLGLEDYSVIVRVHNSLGLFIGELYRLVRYGRRFLIGEVNLPGKAFFRGSSKELFPLPG